MEKLLILGATSLPIKSFLSKKYSVNAKLFVCRRIPPPSENTVNHFCDLRILVFFHPSNPVRQNRYVDTLIRFSARENVNVPHVL